MGLTIEQAPGSGGGGGGMTLLGTLTPTSGTTSSLTGIATGYLALYCEFELISFNSTVAMTVALSSTNGSAYGAAQTATGALGNASHVMTGTIWVENISSVLATSKLLHSVSASGSGSPTAGAATAVSSMLATNTAAVVDAIRFGGGTFDGASGVIRIYGVK